VRILLADHDAALAGEVLRELAHYRFAVEWVSDGIAAQRMLADAPFDVVLLNRELPGKSGSELLRELRDARNPIPVLMLSDHASLDELVDSLNAGADDFLYKPFAIDEAVARIRAMLRRSVPDTSVQFRCGPLSFDKNTRLFELDDTRLSLAPLEHLMLTVLIERAGRTVSRATLVERLFTAQGKSNAHRVELVAHRLRKKLAHAAVTIETCRGVGYRLVEGGESGSD
jgi:two-component system response regulator TctD